MKAPQKKALKVKGFQGFFIVSLLLLLLFYQHQGGSADNSYRSGYNQNNNNRIAMKAKYTFAEFADVWFERHQQEIEEVTVEHYTYILRTIKEHVGRRPLAEITTPEIEDFLNKLRSKSILIPIFGAAGVC